MHKCSFEAQMRRLEAPGLVNCQTSTVNRFGLYPVRRRQPFTLPAISPAM